MSVTVSEEVKETNSTEIGAEEANNEKATVVEEPGETSGTEERSDSASEQNAEVKEPAKDAQASPVEHSPQESKDPEVEASTTEEETVDPDSSGASGSDEDPPSQENVTLEDKLDKLLTTIRIGLSEDSDSLMPELEASGAETLPEIERFRHRVEAAKMAETKQSKQHVKKEKKRRETASSVEALSQALKTMPIEQQVATLFSKYAELVDDNRKLQDAVKTVQRQAQLVVKEKEVMENEHSKIVLTKARLESLCRELQRQNKVIKDENTLRLREEEERRKEVSAKFNTTLAEISSLMKENSDKNTQLRDENQNMASRLQELIKQYEDRESHVEKMLKQKDLQCQLAEAKMAKQHIEVTEDKEKMLLEKKALLEEISAYQQKTQQMSMTEITLRTQLNSYMEKYEEFTSALDKSNKVFNTFKEEIDMMTKKIKKLEKETKSWKERWEGANKALLEMVAERGELEKKLETQTKQSTKLQGLCRALQKEVTELRKQEKGSSVSEGDSMAEDKEKISIGDSSTSSDVNADIMQVMSEEVNNKEASDNDAPVEDGTTAKTDVKEVTTDKPEGVTEDKPTEKEHPPSSNFDDVD